MPATTYATTASGAAASPSVAAVGPEAAATNTANSEHIPTSPSAATAHHNPTSRKHRRPDDADEAIDPAADPSSDDGGAGSHHAGALSLFIGPEMHQVAAAAAADEADAAADEAEHDDEEATADSVASQKAPPVPNPNRNQELEKTPFKTKKGSSMGVNKIVAIKVGIFEQLNLSRRQAEALPTDYPKSAWIFGKIVSGTRQKGYKVKMDAPFPSDDNIITLVGRRPNDIKAIDASCEDLQPFNLARYLEDKQRLDKLGCVDDEDPSTGKKRRNCQQESADDFDKLTKEARATAIEYKSKWGKEDDDFVKWQNNIQICVTYMH